MRIFPNKFGALRLPEGSYGQDLRGRWWLRPPSGNARSVEQRDVRLHPDGTITVSGFVLCGQWRQV